MRGLLRDAGVILVAVLALGTVANLVPARHLAWWGQGHQPPQAGVDFQLIDAGSADSLRASLHKVVFLDDRSAAEYSAGHIPGAEPVSYTDIRGQLTPARVAELRASDAVVVYGASEETDVEQLLAQELRRRGLPPPYVLLGGFASWQGAALPVGGNR